MTVVVLSALMLACALPASRRVGVRRKGGVMSTFGVRGESSRPRRRIYSLFPLGAMVAIPVVGCSEEPTKLEARQGREGMEVAAAVSCQEVEAVVEAIREGLGCCTPNYMNEEPLIFSRSACDAQLYTACDAMSSREARRYVDCLAAVGVCDPARQATFDEAIDECLDMFQEGPSSGDCIELIIGD